MQQEHQTETSPDVVTEGINLLDLLLLFTSRWQLLAALVVVFAIFGALTASLRPVKYTARVSFTTQSEPTGGTGSLLFLGRQQDPTVALLKSNSVADLVVKFARLQDFPQSRPKKLTDARLYYRGLVASETKVVDGGDGLYEIQVADPIPERGTAIANSFLSALQEVTFRMNTEGASISRRFFQSQLDEARGRLASSEQQLRDAQARTGLLQPGSQTGQELAQISALRSQLVTLQVQRATLEQSATAENPDMVRLSAEIAETQNRIAALSAKTHRSDESGIPTQNLELARSERDVQEQQAVVNSLLTQFERAQIQERFTAPRVRTVDRAELPLPAASRHTFVLTAIGAFVGFLIGAGVVIFSEMKRKLVSNPSDRRRIQDIRASLTWR